MNLLPLIRRLETARLGKQGKDLFASMMPAEVTKGILLRGPYTGTKINAELPGFYKTEFQLIVRSPDVDTGLALINKAIDTLTLANETVGTQFFNYSRACTLPVSFPLSKGNLIEHTVRFDVCYVEQ